LVKSGPEIGLLDHENLEGVFEDGLSLEHPDPNEEDPSLGHADVIGNLNYDALFDVGANTLPPLGDVSSRRKVDQRWFYKPVFSEPVSEPILAKRQSQRPQRLTSSRLGRVSSEPEIMELIGAPSNGSYRSCPLIGSEMPMEDNDFATVPSMSVVSVLASTTLPVPCDGDDFISPINESL
jgi:hypothetical protein